SGNDDSEIPEPYFCVVGLASRPRSNPRHDDLLVLSLRESVIAKARRDAFDTFSRLQVSQSSATTVGPVTHLPVSYFRPEGDSEFLDAIEGWHVCCIAAS